jgi:hypothetical protein
MRFTTAPPYWGELDEWKKAYQKRDELRASEMPGYGVIPGTFFIRTPVTTWM